MTAMAVRPPTAALRRPTPAWWRDASLSVAAASLLFVGGLWLSGLHGVSSTGELITSIGRLAGLLGSDLLLIQVLLMARIPMVERSFGQDTLARVHRRVGFTSFTLVLTHIPLVLIGYAVLDNHNLLRETVSVVWTYPGMLLATAGFAALVMVVVTSIKAARAKLRYESWHLLHLYAYLGVGLALPHQLWTGGDFVAKPAAAVFWWTAWGLTAATVACFRFIAPVILNGRHRLIVRRVVIEGPGLVTVHLTGKNLDALPVRAGQFFVFRFRDGEGWTRGNPYSLSAAPDGRTLRSTIKDNGRLVRLKPGTRVYLEGPFGTLTRTSQRKLAVLANGIGLTPGLSLLQEAPYDAVLIHRTAAPLLLADLEALQDKGTRVVHITGPRARRRSWLPQQAAHLSDAEALKRLVPDLASRDVFISGTAEWVELAAAAATAAGLPKEQLHVERFSW